MPPAKGSRPAARGRSLHHALFFRLASQGKPGQSVGDEIHPQDLDRGERHRQPEQRCDQQCQDFPEVPCEHELHELADVVIDAATLTHCTDDRRKVVVEQHDVRCLARNVSAHAAHSDADVRLLQRRCVIDAIARHRDEFTPILQRLDDRDLLLGVHPRIDPSFMGTRREICGIHPHEVPSGDEPVLPRLEDAETNGNRVRSQRMVAGDHHRRDPRVYAFRNSPGGFRPRRIDQADEAEKREIGFGVIWRQERRNLRPVAARDRKHAKTIPGQLLSLDRQAIPVDRLPPRGANGRRAPLQHTFGRTLGQRDDRAVRPALVQGRHALAIGIERQFGDASALLLELSFDKPRLRGRGVQGGFGGITDHPPVPIERRIVVQRERAHERLPWLLCELSAVWPGVVCLAIDEIGFGAHPVLGQRPGLVGADVGDRAKGLDRGQSANERVLPDHPLRAHCKPDRDHGR